MVPYVELRRYDLPDDHNWRARPGCKIMIAGRGAVILEFPDSWHVQVGESSVQLHDAPPPGDECRLELSFRSTARLEPEEVPMEEFLRAALQDARSGSRIGPIQSERRHDLGLVWAEQVFDDGGRLAASRVALALGRGVQVLMTMDFWPEDRERIVPIWELVLGSLRVGRVVRDPLQGSPEDPGLN